MRERLLKTKDRGHFPRLLQLLALFTLFFALPQTAWGDGYFVINTTPGGSRWVSDTAGEDYNVDNILGDGTMSYDVANNILTLNNINLALTGGNSDAYFIQCNDADHLSLTVRLIGENTLTLGDSNGFFYGANVSFITDASSPGSLTITTTNWAGTIYKGYFSNDNYSVAYCDKLRMVHTDESTYTIQTVEPTGTSYGLTVAGTPVTSGNATDVLGNGKVSFNANSTPVKLSFTGRNYINYPGHCINTTESIEIDVETGGNLYLNSTGDGNYPFYSANDVQIKFDSNFDANIQGKNNPAFSPKCVPLFGTYTSNGELVGPQIVYSASGYTIKKYEASDFLELQIDGNFATTDNKSDILGDGSVSFTDGASSGTLTLNNANIGEVRYSGDYANFTINLTGTNYITKRFLNSFLLCYYYPSGTDPTLTFTGDGELWLQTDDENFTSADYDFVVDENGGTTDNVDYSANFTTGGWAKEFISASDSPNGKPYLRIYKGPAATGYGLTVGGVAVTSANADNVLNDDYSSVSYDATTNTLTLKGVHLNSTNNGISVSSDLNINLVGYSNVGTINVTSGTLNFTTSTTLPGCLITNITGNSTITYGDGTGLSWDGSMVKSSSTNPYIIYATGCKMDGDNYCISGGDFSVKDNKGDEAALDVSTDGTVANSLNNASIDYYKVSSNSKSCYIYPASLEDMNLVNKVYFLFDWGTCTNKDVKVQIKGLDSNYANDGTYSEEVSLPADGGLVEIPLTGTVNSYYFQIYFSSSTGEFSFIPISVGFLKTEGYGLTVAGVEVTPDNASNITGANIQGTVSYDVENHKLTLNGVTLTSPIHWGTDANLTIELKGTNSMNTTNGVCISSEYERAISFTGGDNNCSLELSVTDDYFFSGFSNTDNPSMGTGMYWIPTWDDGTITSALITNAILGGGAGTEESPFIISSFEHLKTFAKYINDGILSTEYFQLGGDIDCTGKTGFEPIGNTPKSFIGTFDGGGNSISGLSFSNTIPDGVSGLFGNIGKINYTTEEINRGTVKNLILNGCQFGNASRNGAIAGNLAYGTIENCTVTSCTISSGNSQSTFSGGITGIVEADGIVKNCTVNDGTITSSTSDTEDGEVCAGGIVAYAYGGSEINGCTVTDVSINSTGNDQKNSYSGGIVGSSQATISGNTVNGKTTVNSINNNNDFINLAGAIVAKREEGLLTNNYYYFTVKTRTTYGDNDPVEKSVYTQRAVGGIRNEQTLQYEDAPDITENNGAVMYTKPLTVGVASECNYYEPLSSEGILALAPGETVDISLSPADGIIISNVSLVYTPTGGTEQAVALENFGNPDGYNYSFEMPDAEATLNITYRQLYNLWIGETQVTSDNAANVLGDDNGSVSFSATVGVDTAPTYTLTLNGATLTAPVKVGLPNLTIDIQGTNSIITDETCIQKLDETTPAVTFKSTSDVVGSLTLNGAAGVNNIGVDGGSFSISDELALVLKKDGYIYSNQYWFTDGSTKEAKLSPSYGVTVGSMQICPDNAADVIGDGIGDGDDSGMVSFDKDNSILTLNNASLSGIIRSSLPNLKIELVGDNSIYSGGDRILQAGVAVNMTIQSSAAEKGSLSMHKGFSSSEKGNFVDDNVTLTISAPLAVISGSLTDDIDKNDYYAVIGESYGLTVAGVIVSKDNAANITGGGIAVDESKGGKVSYDAATHTLTLKEARLFTNESHPEPMITCNGDLIIQLTGENYIVFSGDYANYVVKNTGNSGTLTITQSGTDAVLGITSDFCDGDSKGLCDGFSAVNFANGLAYSIYSGSKRISTLDLASPSYYLYDNTLIFQSNGLLYGTNNNGEVVGAEYFYKITYVDSSTEGSGVEHQLNLDYTICNIDQSQTIAVGDLAGPCTIETYTKLNGETSTANKAKKFGPAENPMRLVYGADPVDFVLAPAIEEGDGIKVNGIEANVTYNATSGKVSSSTLGSHGAVVSLGYQDEPNKTTILLNNYFNMDFDVVPPAPTISLAAGTYLKTQNLSVTLTASEIANTAIEYKWDDGDWTAYSTPLVPETGTHTLYARVKYQDATPVYSDEVSATYTVSIEEYDLWVNGTKVTSENADNVLGGASATVIYDKESKTLTLNNAAIDGTIESGLDELTIEFTGTNSLNGTSGYINSTNANAVLTIKGGAGTSTLSLTNSVGESAVKGFASVTLDGAYLKTTNCCRYVSGDAPQYQSPHNNMPVQDITFTTKPHYLLWIRDYQVSDDNKDNIFNETTSTAVFTPSSNTLTLNGLESGSQFGIESGLENLTISLIGDNYIYASYYAGYNAIFSINEGATLTIQKAGTADCNLSLGAYDQNPVIKGFKSVSYTGLNFVSRTGNALDGETTSDAILSSATIYPLWVENILVTEVNKTNILNEATATVTFNNNTLTFNGAGIDFTGNTVVTGIENLKVNLVGTNSFNTGEAPTFAFQALTTSASIEFEGEGSLAITTYSDSPFTGFGEGKITYNKLVCWKVSERVWGIRPPTAPVMAVDDNNKVTLTKEYDDGDIYYTIDYADEEKVDVSKTKYEESFAMDAPGTVEAWVEANGATTSTVKGKYFGYDGAPLSMATGETKTPVLVPAFEAGDNIGYLSSATPFESNNTGVATFESVTENSVVSGKITAKAMGTATLTTKLAYTNESNHTLILNPNNEFTTELTVGIVFDVSNMFSGTQTYATYYNSTGNNMTLPDGMTAAMVTGVNESGTSVTTTALTYIPKDAAVLLGKGTSTGSPASIIYTGDEVSTTDNKLVYTSENKATENKEFYVLYKDEFVKATGTIPVGKCYLDLTGVNIPSGARGLGIENDGTTGIHPVNSEEGIVNSDVWYNLQGRRIEKPTKAGLYIKNGKKVIVNNK